MHDLFIGEIILFSKAATIVDCLPCDGREVKIEAYPDLYEVIGNQYGPASAKHFKIPDLRGRFPMHSLADVGTLGGSNEITITEANLPPHSHDVKVEMRFKKENTRLSIDLQAYEEQGTDSAPEGALLARSDGNAVADREYRSTGTDVPMHADCIKFSGQVVMALEQANAKQYSVKQGAATTKVSFDQLSLTVNYLIVAREM